MFRQRGPFWPDLPAGQVSPHDPCHGWWSPVLAPSRERKRICVKAKSWGRVRLHVGVFRWWKYSVQYCDGMHDSIFTHFMVVHKDWSFTIWHFTPKSQLGYRGGCLRMSRTRMYKSNCIIDDYINSLREREQKGKDVSNFEIVSWKYLSLFGCY